MEYIEVTTEEAIELLKKAKGKRVMIAIQNLEKDESAIFYPRLKKDCETMITEAETVASLCDDFVKQLRLFTKKQKDIKNIRPMGFQKTILLRE